MAAGCVVFDGAPEQLTDAAAREIYGLEADDVLESAPKAPAWRGSVPALGEVAAA